MPALFTCVYYVLYIKKGCTLAKTTLLGPIWPITLKCIYSNEVMYKHTSICLGPTVHASVKLDGLIKEMAAN